MQEREREPASPPSGSKVQNTRKNAQHNKYYAHTHPDQNKQDDAHSAREGQSRVYKYLYVSTDAQGRPRSTKKAYFVPQKNIPYISTRTPTHPSRKGSGRKCVMVMASPKALVPRTDKTISRRPWSTARTYVGAIGLFRDLPRVRATTSTSPGANPFVFFSRTRGREGGAKKRYLLGSVIL